MRNALKLKSATVAVLPDYVRLALLHGSPQTSTEKSTVLIVATVMAPSIQVFLQVSLLCCVVNTSIGGITDFQKAFSQLENKVKVSQEETKSLYQMTEQLEKRLKLLEAKGEFYGMHIDLLYTYYDMYWYNCVPTRKHNEI